MTQPTDSAVVTSSSDDGALSAIPCTLRAVVVGVPESGKYLSIYDGSSSSGTLVARILLTSVGEYTFGGGVALATGLFAETDATGTARVTLVWG